MLTMIRSFRCEDTRALFAGENPKRFRAFKAQAERKLQMLGAAEAIIDLRNPPGNRLESLGGDRSGQWSIRINQRWRLCFVWRDDAAWDVEIVDYH
jgi:proteic killer suppression protein